VTAKGRIDYFVVVANGKEDARVLRTAKGLVLLVQPEKELFEKLEEDYKAVKDDLEEQASVVQDFDSKSARVPWLERTQFVSYLATLKDKEIRGSYKLPPRKEGAADAEDINLV
jgi:hypothetical protein